MPLLPSHTVRSLSIAPILCLLQVHEGSTQFITLHNTVLYTKLHFSTVDLIAKFWATLYSTLSGLPGPHLDLLLFKYNQSGQIISYFCSKCFFIDWLFYMIQPDGTVALWNQLINLWTWLSSTTVSNIWLSKQENIVCLALWFEILYNTVVEMTNGMRQCFEKLWSGFSRTWKHFSVSSHILTTL